MCDTIVLLFDDPDPKVPLPDISGIEQALRGAVEGGPEGVVVVAFEDEAGFAVAAPQSFGDAERVRRDVFACWWRCAFAGDGFFEQFERAVPNATLKVGVMPPRSEDHLSLARVIRAGSKSARLSGRRSRALVNFI